MNNENSYDSKTIYYHWASAAIILALWILGQTIDWFPKGTPRINARSIHIALGLALAVIFIFRLHWRIRCGTRLPQATPGLSGKLATAAHHVLYLLIGLTLIIGVSAVWIRGDHIFNLFQIPAFDPTDKQLREDVVDIHGLLANALLILAGGHGMMALWHHFIMKDGVLRRMWPRLKTS